MWYSKATCLWNFWSCWELWVLSKAHYLPIICDSHDHQYVYYTDKPAIPLLVAFTPPWHSIELVYKLILDTNVNSTNHTPFCYVDYPPCWSASIPIAMHLSAHGYFSPSIPRCFILDHKEEFLKGDIVVLGQDTCQKVVMEEIIEVGKHFILYKVKEVQLIPKGDVQITQLVAPLNSHPSVFLHFLLLIIMAFFPCFFQSSAVFMKIDRASGGDEIQSQFSDSSSMV